MASSLPPLVCPSGGAVASIDLRVASPSNSGTKPLPLRTIIRLEEGDKILYKPLLRQSEVRKGDVAMVLVPAKKSGAGEQLRILEPKPADKPQEWTVPWRTSLVAFVYGPAGLNVKKVKIFLSKDDDLVGELADYAEKTTRTEALIATLSNNNSSGEAVQAALQGFSAQYAGSAGTIRGTPMDQQAMVMFRTVNPAVAGYDPLAPQMAQPIGQAAGLVTSVAEMFFGSPIGLAAGGTAFLLNLGSLAFPRSAFRSTFSEALPDDGMGLCGKVGEVPPHTRLAYLWASRVPNAAPPKLTIEKANSLPPALKSPLPLSGTDADWKFLDRARDWALEPDTGGKPIPITVQSLASLKRIELNPGKNVKAGKYKLLANWDWDRFEVGGAVEVRPLSDFGSAKLVPSSQDHLVAKTGKVPVTLEGSDFEFVSKVEIEKQHDEFATPSTVPFVLPKGLREGEQPRMDIQVDAGDLDSGEYKLMISQVDGKPHVVNVKVLAALPTIENLPLVTNQGVSTISFEVRGQRLNLLQRVEISDGTAELGAPSPGDTERELTVHVSPKLGAGTSLALRAFIQNRSTPLIFSNAVRIVGPRPSIRDVTISRPPHQDVHLGTGELPGGTVLSAMMHVKQLESSSALTLSCSESGAPPVTLHLGEHSGSTSLQQLTPDQIFVTFDTGHWFNGCDLQAALVNGPEGQSDIRRIGRIVRVPEIQEFDLTTDDTGQIRASLTGENLETIEKTGWSPDQGKAVDQLPQPLDGGRQRLEIRIPAQPDPSTPLYLWLRGEEKPRLTSVHPN